MKKSKFLLALPLLASCSSSSNSVETTMVPLTTIGKTTTTSVSVQYSKSDFAFFDDLYYFYDGYPVMSNEETIEIARLWCELMIDGMTSEDVIYRINEGAIDQNDINFHFAVVKSAVNNICPSQKEKWSM